MERDLQFTKPYQLIVKNEKYATFCVSKLLIRRQKWVAGILLVVRRVSPGRIIAVLFLTEYVVPRYPGCQRSSRLPAARSVRASSAGRRETSGSGS